MRDILHAFISDEMVDIIIDHTNEEGVRITHFGISNILTSCEICANKPCRNMGIDWSDDTVWGLWRLSRVCYRAVEFTSGVSCL